MADEKHKLRNQILVPLVVPAISSLILYLVPGGWPWVASKTKDIVAGSYRWLVNPILVPNWLFWLLCLVGAAVVVVLIMMLTGKNPSATQSQLFTKSEFFGILWRWLYHQDGGIHSVTPFCPRCDLQLQPKPRFYVGSEETTYECE